MMIVIMMMVVGMMMTMMMTMMGLGNAEYGNVLLFKRGVNHRDVVVFRVDEVQRGTV